jgi:hypothetical protein
MLLIASRINGEHGGFKVTSDEAAGTTYAHPEELLT